MQQMITREELFALYVQLTPAQQKLVVGLVESLLATRPRNAERNKHNLLNLLNLSTWTEDDIAQIPGTQVSANPY